MLLIQQKSKQSKAPTKAHITDAGFDLYLPEAVELDEGIPALVDLDISLAIPEGYFGLITPRSSMANRRVLLANTVGIVDSGYRGNIKVALIYMPSKEMTKSIFIDAGERVAQIIIIPHYQFGMVPTESLDDTERGEGGFGSTGI